MKIPIGKSYYHHSVDKKAEVFKILRDFYPTIQLVNGRIKN
jgi:hypothetical protein